jgi:hypothetical protein
MVWVVSLEDQETSLQTPHTDLLVSTVAVRLEQPIRGEINSIASAYRILCPPQSIGSRRSLNFGHGIRPDLKIDPAKSQHN